MLILIKNIDQQIRLENRIHHNSLDPAVTLVPILEEDCQALTWPVPAGTTTKTNVWWRNGKGGKDDDQCVWGLKSLVEHDQWVWRGGVQQYGAYTDADSALEQVSQSQDYLALGNDQDPRWTMVFLPRTTVVCDALRAMCGSVVLLQLGSVWMFMVHATTEDNTDVHGLCCILCQFDAHGPY